MLQINSRNTCRGVAKHGLLSIKNLPSLIAIYADNLHLRTFFHLRHVSVIRRRLLLTSRKVLTIIAIPNKEYNTSIWHAHDRGIAH